MNRTIGIICTCAAILAIGLYRPTSRLPECPHEYGGGPLPCLWDTQVDGVQGPTIPATRYMILVRPGQTCPATGEDTVCRTAG